MNIDMKGHVAIVTGAGRGIGRATALELARLGARVLVNDSGVTPEGLSPDAGPASEVAAEIRAQGGEAEANADSVSDRRGAERIVAEAMDRWGRIDALVNNAGTVMAKPLLEVDPEDFRRVVTDHVIGTFNMTQLVAREMKSRGYGRIVNFVSRAGLHGSAGSAAYGTGKGGIYGFTNVVFRELQPLGILVNAVNPAATRTRMVVDAMERAVRGGMDQAQAKRMLSVMQEPERIAVITAALCSEACKASGQYFFVQKDSVGLFSPITAGTTLVRPGGWSAGEFAEALGNLQLPPPVSIY